MQGFYFALQLWLVFAVSFVDSTSDVANEKILFEVPGEFPISLLVKNLKNHSEDRINLTFNMNVLKQFNVTREEVERGYIEVNANGESDFIVNGQRYLLDITTDTVMHFKEPLGGNGTGISINLSHFNKMSMKDIEDDSNLVPDVHSVLSWKNIPRCRLRDMTVTIKAFETMADVNNKLTVNISLNMLNKSRTTIHSLSEGLLLMVINPNTCRKTFSTVLATSDFGGYRDLLRSLQSITEGRIILIASVRDGASFLIEKAKKYLHSMGSLFVPYYLYRDIYMHLFIQGGKTLHEVLVPNLGSYNCSGSPISTYYNFHTDPYDIKDVYSTVCSSWPSGSRWEARRIFCDEFDGFKELCSCNNPFDIADRKEPFSDDDTLSIIPIIIVAGFRTHHFFHLLRSIGFQKGISKDLFVIVTDGHHEETARLVYILGLKLLVHKPEGIHAMRISRNFRFALYNGLEIFPNASALIVLEEDLLVSPDFYSYMNQLEPIFKMDKSVFCVNAFNHLAFSHTSRDPTMLYRAQTYPAYGWMMSREILLEIIPKWLPITAYHDWDYFIGSEIVRASRECIIPDINRSYHWSTMGFHMKASYFSEAFFLSRTFNKDPHVKLQPLKRLLKDNYEKEFVNLLKTAIPLTLTEDTAESQLEKIKNNTSYVIYVQRKTDTEGASFRQAGELLNVWSNDCRDTHNSAWRLHYFNSTIFVVGFPFSPYSSMMPANQTIIVGNAESDHELDMAEVYERGYRYIPRQIDIKILPYPFWGKNTKIK